MKHSLFLTIPLDPLIKVVLLGVASFSLSMLITPLYTRYAYKKKLWKKPRTSAATGENASVYQKLHKTKHNRHIPTMAGVIFVVATFIITLVANLDRSETWLPLAAMMGAGLVGMVDDILNIHSTGGIAGMRAKIKMLLIVLVSLVGGIWFYTKLNVDSIGIPFFGSIFVGWLIIPVFVFVVVATANAVNISDGLDGLSGGLSAIAFGVYAIIAFVEQRYGVAGFCFTLVCALLSYTWFNVFPARFFMGDLGSFAIGTALGVVAMLTDTVLLLPIIGFVFVAEAGSVIIQTVSKKIRSGKKVFKIAPIHHHFEAIGWEETKVTMRFWIIGQMTGTVGLIIFLMSRG